jgi:hypothetical protein
MYLCGEVSFSPDKLWEYAQHEVLPKHAHSGGRTGNTRFGRCLHSSRCFFLAEKSKLWTCKVDLCRFAGLEEMMPESDLPKQKISSKKYLLQSGLPVALTMRLVIF